MPWRRWRGTSRRAAPPARRTPSPTPCCARPGPAPPPAARPRRGGGVVGPRGPVCPLPAAPVGGARGRVTFRDPRRDRQRQEGGGGGDDRRWPHRPDGPVAASL